MLRKEPDTSLLVTDESARRCGAGVPSRPDDVGRVVGRHRQAVPEQVQRRRGFNDREEVDASITGGARRRPLPPRKRALMRARLRRRVGDLLRRNRLALQSFDFFREPALLDRQPLVMLRELTVMLRQVCWLHVEAGLHLEDVGQRQRVS